MASMLEQVERVNGQLEGGIRHVSACGEAIKGSVGTAVRSLQFEDIASQALGTAGVHLQRLQQINEEATRLQDLLQQRAPGRQWAEALGAFADRLHGLRQQWATPVHHPVSQQNMGEGEIELF